MRRERPSGFWQDLILRALRHLDGEADLKDITEWIGDNTDLTDRELEDSGYEGRPRYAHTVRSCAHNMTRDNKLVRLRRGRYRVADF